MSRHRGSFPDVLVGPRSLLLAAAVALLPAPTTAQDTTSRVPTTTVLKRIGGAVDGYRAGGIVWVVLDSTQQVAGIVSSRELAEARARDLRGPFEIHGPFRAPPLASASLVAGCVYFNSTLINFCPEIPLSDITGLTLVIRTRDGRSRPIEVPLGADVIFLTMSGFDKFGFPYYVRVDGVDGAVAMRRRMLGRAP